MRVFVLAILNVYAATAYTLRSPVSASSFVGRVVPIEIYCKPKCKHCDTAKVRELLIHTRTT